MFDIDIRFELKKHEAITIALIIILALVFFSEITIDSGSCSKKLPDIDCSQRGIVTYNSIITNANSTHWIQTTGGGLHWVTAINPNGSSYFYPVPEFRNGFQHAVCDLNGTTVCEYHYDTYNALDFPFGTILHLADTLTLYVGVLNEDLWQATIWILLILGIYFLLRFIEHKLED